MSKAGLVLGSADCHRHFVQLYDGTPRLLAKNVGEYLAEGLKQGEPAIVVATAEHTDAFCRELGIRGINSQAATRNNLLYLLNAEQTLAQFMVNGRPDWELFSSSVRAVVRQVQSRAMGRGLRAYGEMVGVLWTQGRFSAAMVLEEFWNTILESADFRLFCAYPIDVFSKAFHSCDMDALLCSHTHLLPGEANGPLESAVDRAMTEVLGADAERLKNRISSAEQPSWSAGLKAEAQILWLRANVREHADEILGRARKYYYAA